MPQSLLSANHDLRTKRDRILDKNTVLCRDDVIWMLDYVKQRVAHQDPELLKLSQARLLENFQAFAEAAMMLIHGRSMVDVEADRIKMWVTEASHGLQQDHNN